ncbi:rhamnulokinase [Enterococcus sp. AZ196]|uniref:rhamnulokinase n=1 Tax=Enterococcus sp. AZ196 TaxID=2774659 RepID=UPI003D2B6FE6
MKKYIAIDIGASSGRLMESELIDGQLTLQEVHRFKNEFRLLEGFQRWDIHYLIQEILIGLEKVKRNGTNHCFVGIDTWAVDYCLVDKTGGLLGEPIAYRDNRTKAAVEDFQRVMSLEKLYEKTGIQIQSFNTIFQLFVEKRELLEAADKLLLIPDYLGYVFTGRGVMEKTNASTMQLLNPGSESWDEELLNLVGIKKEQLPPLVDAGTILGSLLKEKFVDFDLPDATFVSVASHDTASAILGTPGQGSDWGYISSGTWSLLGIETTVANVSREAFSENYTNEWGAHNTIRFLKNIMGMWLIQETARMQKYEYSYPELAELAAKEPPFQQFIDVNHHSFLNPDNMIAAIQDYCKATGQLVPETPGAIARCIYDNLALCYASELEKLEQMTGTNEKINTLHIVGGGSNNKFLNQLTADAAQIEISAGPSEATAIGNILMQMVAAKEFASIEEGRNCILKSFAFSKHLPQAFDRKVLEQYQKFIAEGAMKNE